MSTYSTNLALELIGTGEQAGTWGNTTNTNLGTLIEQAISGYVTQAVATGTDTTLTIPNGATGVARNMYIELTGTGGTNTNLIVPSNKKLYFIYNNSTGAVTVKVSGQTGVSVAATEKKILVSNGTDIVEATSYITAINSSLTLTTLNATSANITTLSGTAVNYGSATISSGNLTFSSTAQRITGDMSNATISNRLAFQTSTANSNTSVAAIPSGTATQSAFSAFNASDPTNSSTMQLICATADSRLTAGATGTGTNLPMTFYTGGSERMRLDTSGRLSVNTSTANTNSYLTVIGNISVASPTRNQATTGQIGNWTTDDPSDNRRARITLGTTAGASSSDSYIAFSTNQYGVSDGERMRIDSSGNVGIGGTAGADTKVDIVGTLPTDTQRSRGFRVSGTIPSGTTVNAVGFQSLPATEAASFTLSNLWGFVASQGTFGASSVVTNQMGFLATSLLTGATNNYGFYSDIASGSNRWNFYANGTAANYFAGNVQIGSNTGQRIIGDFSDATKSNRLSFQTSVANSSTNIQVIPSGTGTRSSLFLFSDQSANNCSLGAISVIGASSQFAIESAIEGSGTYLPMTFRTNNAERMRITTDGEVYIAGTTDQGAYNLQCNGTGVWGAGAYVNGSDARLKDNIQSLDSGLDVVKAMRPVTFQYKPDYSKDQSVQPGFIAQELQTAMAGKSYLEGVVQEGPNHLNVAYQSIIPILVKAIQELSAKVATLEAK